MDKKMKSGILKSLTRNEMKNVFGGLNEVAKCSDSNCQKDDNGVRKKCPTGCVCESSESRPCYKP